jgi:hypothetical protein
MIKKNESLVDDINELDSIIEKLKNYVDKHPKTLSTIGGATLLVNYEKSMIKEGLR